MNCLDNTAYIIKLLIEIVQGLVCVHVCSLASPVSLSNLDRKRCCSQHIQ